MVIDRSDLDALPAEAYLVTLEELASLLVEEASLQGLLEQVLELTARAIPVATAVSVTVVGDDGSYATVATTSTDALLLDQKQYELAQGPCVDALETGEENLLSDLTEVDRWPEFCERARQLGFGAVLAVPLRVDAQPIGALNVFAREANGLDAESRQVARRIAAPAAATLANARAYRRVARLADQLQTALESRASIEQAKGVMMAAGNLTADEAFQRLRKLSQDRNIPIRDLARQLVEHTSNGRPA